MAAFFYAEVDGVTGVTSPHIGPLPFSFSLVVGRGAKVCWPAGNIRYTGSVGLHKLTMEIPRKIHDML